MNNNHPQVDEMIKGMGALAEAAKLTYDAYINVGFTPSQAMDLTKLVIKQAFMQTQQPPYTEDF